MMAGCALYNSFDGLRRQTALCVDCIAFLKRTLTVEEANKYLNKWGAICNSPELVSLFTAVTDKTEELKNQYTVFLDVYNNEYLPALAEIQRETEGLSKQHSNVESLEGKLKKGKATQGEVDGATKQLETDTARVQGDTYVKYRTAEIALTKAYVKLHENMANLFKAQLTKLESSPPSLDKPAPAAAQPAATQPVQPAATPAQPAAQPVATPAQPAAAAPAAADDDDGEPPGPVGAITPAADDEAAPPPYDG